MQTTLIITHDTPRDLQEQLGRTQHALFINDELPDGVVMKSDINIEQVKNRQSIEKRIKAIKMSIDHVKAEMQEDDIREANIEDLREEKQRLESSVQLLEWTLEPIVCATKSTNQ